MKLDAGDDDYRAVQAMPALAMAMLEQNGVCDMIDEALHSHDQGVLTPGRCVKMLVGAMFQNTSRVPMYLFDLYCATAPIDLLCGEDVTQDDLDIAAVCRVLDRLSGSDLPSLVKRIHGRLCEVYGLSSSVFDMNLTDLDVSVVDAEGDDASSEDFDPFQDGIGKRSVYSLQTVTDGNGVVCHERLCAPVARDSAMDALDSLAGGPDGALRTTLVADRRLMDGPLMERMLTGGFGFVTGCPDDLGDGCRDAVIKLAETEGMTPSASNEGWELYDTDREMDGRMLRFVAIRAPVHEAGRPRKRDLGDSDLFFGGLADPGFESEAMAEFEEALRLMGPSACIVGGESEVFGDEEYSAAAMETFSEDLAGKMAGGMDVLVTNLPRSDDEPADPRDGITADGVLNMYMWHHLLMHAFRVKRSRLLIDSACIEPSSRADAFMFIVSVAATLAGSMSVALRRAGIPMGEAMAYDFHTLLLELDREKDVTVLRGPSRLKERFIGCLDALGIDAENLFFCQPRERFDL